MPESWCAVASAVESTETLQLTKRSNHGTENVSFADGVMNLQPVSMIVQAYAVSDHRIFGALDVSAGGFIEGVQDNNPTP